MADENSESDEKDQEDGTEEPNQYGGSSQDIDAVEQTELMEDDEDEDEDEDEAENENENENEDEATGDEDESE